MRLRLLLLSGSPTSAVGVDLETEGLRRIQWREATALFAPFDVIEAQAMRDEDLPFPSDMTSAIDPVRVGRLRGRKAEKLVRPLVHRGGALLGGATPSITYWTLGDTAASVSLVDPAAGPVVERDPNHHLRCRFRAGRLDHDLPVDDSTLEEKLSHPTANRLAGRTLARALGWAPARVVVALSAPEDGRCHKVVAGLVPRP